jgi:hypothetical protein
MNINPPHHQQEDTVNDRNRNDIHTGDRVRLEHTLAYGEVLAEDGPAPEDRITVKWDDGSTTHSKRRMFVPVVDRKPKL